MLVSLWEPQRDAHEAGCDGNTYVVDPNTGLGKIDHRSRCLDTILNKWTLADIE